MPAAVERYSITGSDDPLWLPLRHSDVTATDVPVLFGVHRFKTPYGLFREKRGDVGTSVISVNARMERGKDLEQPVLEKFKKRFPAFTNVRLAQTYLRDAEHHLGATPDAYGSDEEAKTVVIEIKTTSNYEFKKWWTPESAPDYVLLQILTQLYLADAAYGIVVVLDVDRWELHFYRVDRFPEVEAEIARRAKQFMADVDTGHEPNPDFTRDGATIAAQFLYPARGKTIDLRHDNRAPELCREYLEIGHHLTSLRTKRDTVVAELEAKIGDAEYAQVDGYDITFKQIHRRAYEVPALDYRRLYIVPDRTQEPEENPNDKDAGNGR